MSPNSPRPNSERQQLKTVLITGGASGIGLERAKLLMETRQYRLILLGRNRNKLEDAARSLGGPDFVSVAACDLNDSAQIRKTIERIVGTHQGIYGLVNNAGIYPFGGISTTTETSWDEAMNVNLKAPFLLIQG